MDALLARAVSFPCAVLVTFSLNRALTFNTVRRAHGSTLLVRYSAVQLVGALTNLAIYIGLVQWLPVWGAMPLLPLAIAAVCSWALTFLGSKLVFEGSVR